MNTLRYLLYFIFLACSFHIIEAQPLTYYCSSEIQFGDGSFAPYYFSSNSHGIPSIQPNSGFLRGKIYKNTEKSKSVSFGGAIDIVASFNNETPVWIQQLYGELQYKFLKLTIGSKEYSGAFKNKDLSSGGLVWSGNARPIPEVRLGIPSFIAIPKTNGWLQIRGDVSYGIFTDKKWLENHFNYQNSFLTTGVWYHQKQIFFRSKENQRLVITIGGEFAAQFGGTHKIYRQGELIEQQKDKVKIKDFLTVLIPRSGDATSSIGDQAYYYGNHLGAWHFIGEYKISETSKVKGYFEWLFEDGSGIGKLNGWDGLWGIEFISEKRSFLNNVVFEYLQTTNQSGPIHFAPVDFSNSNIHTEATGADNYYNNFFYNGWAHYGMSNGSALLKSPAYNKNGYLRFMDTRVRAFHLGISGFITNDISYRILSSFRRAWGTPFIPSLQINHDFSGLIELKFGIRKIPGFSLTTAFSIDRGNLYGNNTGGKIGISLTNKFFKFKK